MLVGMDAQIFFFFFAASMRAEIIIKKDQCHRPSRVFLSFSLPLWKLKLKQAFVSREFAQQVRNKF